MIVQIGKIIIIGIAVFVVALNSSLKTSNIELESQTTQYYDLPTIEIIYEEETTEIKTTTTTTRKNNIEYLGTFIATGYCPCSKCCGKWAANRPNGIIYTASGAEAEEGYTVSVDPKLIPLGTKLLVNGKEYQAQDTGGAIKGKKLDIYFDNHQDAWDYGRQKVEVYIVK